MTFEQWVKQWQKNYTLYIHDMSKPDWLQHGMKLGYISDVTPQGILVQTGGIYLFIPWPSFPYMLAQREQET